MVNSDRHIFYDPAGKRWKFIARAGMILGLVTSILGVMLYVTILLLPASPLSNMYRKDLNKFTWRSPSYEAAERRFQESHLLQQIKRKMDALPKTHKKQHLPSTAGKTYDTVIGFYVNWDPNSYNSFRQHVDALTYVMPEWLSLTETPSMGKDLGGFTSSFSAGTHDQDLVTLAVKHGVPIIPILNNENADDFQWAPFQRLLQSHAAQVALANHLCDYLVAHKFAGINIDFEPPYEAMSAAQTKTATALMRQGLPKFMALLKQTFTPAHLLVTEDLPVVDANYDYAALSDINDLNILMLYDQNSPTDPPGPIASQTWLEESAETVFAQMDSSKVILGVGNYCYDWPYRQDAKGHIGWAGKGREELIGPELNIARQADATIQMDDNDLNPYFTYQDADNQSRIAYMLDATTAYNEITALKGYEPRGAALWYLGSEDPTIWSFFDDRKLDAPVSLAALRNIDFKLTLDTDTAPEGDELTQITAVSRPGQRTLTTDADGLITGEQYQQYPTPYVMRQFSALKGKTVALTFDDGPDPRWTPQLLQILKENGVHGTFFIIGKEAEQYPWIVKQAWADGDEIGNHTYSHPHIALVSPLRASLEVNSTEMIIEGLTGHRSLLFRPPYGDAPDSSTLGPGDFPLMQMLDNGYVIVGMNIDPKDYLQPGVQNIVRQVNIQLPLGHVILLHDGGGERAQTLQALPLIIQSLKKKGYQFVTISELMGPGWRAKIFPKNQPSQGRIAGFDQVVFETGFAVSFLIHFLFLAAIVLGVLRILLVAPLAIVNRRRAGKILRAAGEFLPSVTVAIPAYNEAYVVCHTIASVLASDYPDLHIIVVNDGSTDETREVLDSNFGAHPRVTIIHKENGGKATALNRAFALAETELVVCMDADTIFTHNTIRLLVRQFADPRVGAVAGNVKVGNRINLQTIWQSLEYITSQNFDRQAFSALNAVAVVPGAVGAWRRSAVMEAGGFETITLAEDTDLTFKIRLLGYYTRCDNEALAFTEAPDSVGALAKQRFRWAFGILQALWKHRRKLFQPRYGAFSLVVMPSMWVFNIILQAIAPLVDLMVILSIFNGQLPDVLWYTLVFFSLDCVASVIAFRLDGENPTQIIWLFWQRFFYRQFMYYIIVKALTTALRGSVVGWGKLQRKATVALPAEKV